MLPIEKISPHYAAPILLVSTGKRPLLLTTLLHRLVDVVLFYRFSFYYYYYRVSQRKHLYFILLWRVEICKLAVV